MCICKTSIGMSEQRGTMGPIPSPFEKDPAFEEMQAGRFKDVQPDCN